MPTNPCHGCGTTLSTKHGRLKWCPDCALERRREKDRKLRKGRPRNPVDLSRPCAECHQTMVVGASNKRKFCDSCIVNRRRTSDRARQRARRAANGHAEKYRDWTLLKKYGITRKQYELLLTAQNGCCAICKRNTSGSRDWSVDHDHQTGKVRGLLCQLCNRFIGLAQDDPKILTAAIQYLKDPVFERIAS